MTPPFLRLREIIHTYNKSTALHTQSGPGEAGVGDLNELPYDRFRPRACGKSSMKRRVVGREEAEEGDHALDAILLVKPSLLLDATHARAPHGVVKVPGRSTHARRYDETQSTG